MRFVLIYFDLQTRCEVVNRVLERLQPGGHILVGHLETLVGVTGQLEYISPSVYLNSATDPACQGRRSDRVHG